MGWDISLLGVLGSPPFRLNRIPFPSIYWGIQVFLDTKEEHSCSIAAPGLITSTWRCSEHSWTTMHNLNVLVSETRRPRGRGLSRKDLVGRKRANDMKAVRMLWLLVVVVVVVVVVEWNQGTGVVGAFQQGGTAGARRSDDASIMRVPGSSLRPPQPPHQRQPSSPICRFCLSCRPTNTCSLCLDSVVVIIVVGGIHAHYSNKASSIAPFGRPHYHFRKLDDDHTGHLRSRISWGRERKGRS